MIDDRSEEPISPAWQCLDKARIIGTVSEYLTNLIYRFIQTVLEINERVLRPELIVQLLAGDHLTRFIEQS
jgi:hypothetical protein